MEGRRGREKTRPVEEEFFSEDRLGAVPLVEEGKPLRGHDHRGKS